MDFNTINIPIDLKKFQIILKELRKSIIDVLLLIILIKLKKLSLNIKHFCISFLFP